MKKLTTILILLLVLSVSVFADDGGIIHGGGKTCPPGQTCLTDGDVPMGGISENSIYGEMLDFLKLIFE